MYHQTELTLDQVMAFTLTDDHARQEAAWESLSWNKSADMIRRALTEAHVTATDKRAKFVGLAAYESADGMVLRDLFDENGGGYLADPALLDRLALFVGRSITRSSTAAQLQAVLKISVWCL